MAGHRRPPPHGRFIHRAPTPTMNAPDPPHKKQRTDAGPGGPGDCNLPPDRFLDVLLAGEDDDAPIAVVAACMRTRDLGLVLAGATGSLRDAVGATFKRWDAQGDRFRAAVAELDEKKAAARTAAEATRDAAIAALGDVPFDDDEFDTWSTRKVALQNACKAEVRAKLKKIAAAPRSPHLPDPPAGVALQCLVFLRCAASVIRFNP